MSDAMEHEELESAEHSPERAGGNSVAHEFYRRRDLANESQELLEALMVENGLNRGVALSVLATVYEHIPRLAQRRDAAAKVAAMDTASVREAMQKFKDLHSRMFLLLNTYISNHGNPEMAFACVMLLLEYPEVAGADSMPGLLKKFDKQCQRASQHRAIKATLHKCLQFFQRKVPELSRLPGQRNSDAREKMRQAQKKIWNKNK